MNKLITKFTIIFFFFFFVLACNKKNEASFELSKSEKVIIFFLDEHTTMNIKALFLYTDSIGKRYLTFQNGIKSDIQFYNFESGNLLFKVNPEFEGPNGVGNYLGYFIESLDEIYLTPNARPELIKINREAMILEKLDYSKSFDGHNLYPTNAMSFVYKPIYIIENKLYVISECNRISDENVVSATIDISTKEIDVLPFTYPVFNGAEDKSRAYSIETDMSRCFDGTHFVYSFFYDENIYITSINHQTVEKRPIKSKFIKSKIETDLESRNMTSDLFRNKLEKPTYGNLIYDKYRKVYYRVAYLETEIEDGENLIELWQFGRKNFSIIILDEDFNIIGETLFPDYIYISTLMFVAEEGLFISNSHYKNPDFDEDKLSFQCFDLTKKN